MSPRLEDSSPTAWLRKQTREIGEQDSLAVDVETATAVPVESWLQGRGVSYAPATGIPMHLIDERRSRQNQARRDPLVMESVDRFTTAFKAGRPFPPIVVYPMGTRLVIVDGNNRHEAAKRAKLEYIHGIVISAETPSEMIQLLTVESNASHGVTPPLEWRLMQAFHLVSLGHGDDVAAEAAGITMVQLRNGRAAAEADARAKILRIHGFGEMSATARQYLNGIKLEPVFHVAGCMAVEQRLTIDQIRDLCRRVKAGRSESEQLSILAEAKRLLVVENAARTAMSKRVSSPKTQLVTGIGLLNNVDPETLVSQIRTTHDRDLVAARLTEVVDKILAIQVAMEQLKDMEE